MTTYRRSHTATQLPDGRVLAVAGIDPGGVTAGTEAFDPVTGTWSAYSG